MNNDRKYNMNRRPKIHDQKVVPDRQDRAVRRDALVLAAAIFSNPNQTLTYHEAIEIALKAARKLRGLDE